MSTQGPPSNICKRCGSELSPRSSICDYCQHDNGPEKSLSNDEYCLAVTVIFTPIMIIGFLFGMTFGFDMICIYVCVLMIRLGGTNSYYTQNERPPKL